MRTCIKILLLLIISISANAQHEYPDSLKQALKKASTDSARYDISRKLAGFYQEDKRDSALYYFEGALLLAQKNNKQLDEASSLNSKGYELMHLGKLPESYQCFPTALKIAENPESENKVWAWYWDNRRLTPRKQRLSVLANIHHNFGHLMGAIGKTDQQIAQYKETKKIAEEIGYTVILGNVYFTRGKLVIFCYQRIGISKRAMI